MSLSSHHRTISPLSLTGTSWTNSCACAQNFCTLLSLKNLLWTFSHSLSMVSNSFMALVTSVSTQTLQYDACSLSNWPPLDTVFSLQLPSIALGNFTQNFLGEMTLSSHLPCHLIFLTLINGSLMTFLFSPRTTVVH